MAGRTYDEKILLSIEEGTRGEKASSTGGR